MSGKKGIGLAKAIKLFKADVKYDKTLSSEYRYEFNSIFFMILDIPQP